MVPASRTSFRDLDFGCATAEEESTRNPALLLAGYLDLHSVQHEVLHGPRFLFLGYKGAGKSAIGEHLRLSAARDSMLFVKQLFLADFPYAEFGQIVQGPTEGAVRYPSAWSWVLLLQLIASFDSDQGAIGRNDPDFQKTVRLLKELGFLPTPSLSQVVLRSSNRHFKTSLPKVAEAQWGSNANTGGLNFQSVVETVRSVATNFETSSQHVIVLDGLDDVLLRGEVQSESLAALVLEVSRLDLHFRRAGSRTKILLMCRTDLYERLPGPNKNKIRQDSSVTLDWFHDPGAPAQSQLMGLANLKARVSDSDLVDVFTEFLPARVPFKGTSTRNTRRYLLELTRHTPRDFLQLLTAIQHSSTTGRISPHQISNGVRHYSSNYFLPEIKDELVGHLSADSIAAGFSLLGRLGRASFHPLNFLELAGRVGQSHLVDTDFLGLLFEFGALGNIVSGHNNRGHYTYRYRNRQSPFNPDRKVTIHRALLPALNILGWQ